MGKNKILRTWICGFLILCFASTLLSQTASHSPAARPSVTVEFENEVQALAKGFEEAFRVLPSGGKYIEISTVSGPVYLNGSVRSVKAMEGVLLIVMEQGLIYAISARDIIKITNDKPATKGGK